MFINPIDTCMSISINSVNTWLKNVFLGKRPDLVFHNHPMVFRFPENIDFFPHFYENKQLKNSIISYHLTFYQLTNFILQNNTCYLYSVYNFQTSIRSKFQLKFKLNTVHKKIHSLDRLEKISSI